nr:40S ribosomal protein S25 [Tanacetum cinerariifolium]
MQFFGATILLIVVTSVKCRKGKQKEKVNNIVLLDKATYDKLLSEALKFKFITSSILSDRLRINRCDGKRSDCLFMYLEERVESLGNEKNLFTGYIDVPLTKKGVEEMVEAGKRISNIPISITTTILYC